MNYFKKTVNNMHPKQLNFSILEFMFWASLASYSPFIVVFLQSKGLTNTSIGAILSINSFIILFAQPLGGMASDALKSVKKVFLLCLIMSALIIQFLPFLYSTIVLAIALAIFTIFESPLPPLMDSWLIGAIRDERELSYGSIRLWGSMGYSIFAYIFGVFVDRTSVNLIFPTFGVMVVLVVLIIGRIKDEKSTDMITNNIKITDMKLGRLLKNYSYITFLIFSMVLYIPHKASFSFLPALFADLGASPGTLGIASSIMAFSEIPIFLLTRKLLKRFKPVHLILTSSVFFLLRQIFYLTATTSTQIILAQLLHGPSFALFLNGAVYYIDSMAPSELKSTAQTFATSLYGGISGIIGSYGGGWVIDNLGIKKLFVIGIYAILIITLLFIVSLAIGRSTQHSETAI